MRPWRPPVSPKEAMAQLRVIADWLEQEGLRGLAWDVRWVADMMRGVDNDTVAGQ